MQSVENQYCLELDLGFQLSDNAVSQIVFSDIPESGVKVNFIQKTLLDQKLLDLLNQHDIDVCSTQVFYILPGKKIPIHIDAPDDRNNLDNQCKLNFVYSKKGSVMQWWKVKNPGKPLIVAELFPDEKYIPFLTEDCEMVWEEQIGFPSLVNVGQPHSIDNCTNEPRLTLSLLLRDLKKSQPLQWNDAVEIFKNFVVRNQLTTNTESATISTC
jgi:hypothetical protein